ncbi:hypothetical protein TNCV_1202221 [Trichonephila clavipes]|nr:hypothetical protein TNCV_1202221 [Trichonephila clavipes]
MAAVDFLHHKNPPTWAKVEPATLDAVGQRQTNYTTQSTENVIVASFCDGKNKKETQTTAASLLSRALRRLRGIRFSPFSLRVVH